MPISPVSVKSGIQSLVSRTIHEFAHTRDGVRVRDANIVELPGMYTESGSAVIRNDNGWGGPMDLRLLEHLGGEHLVHMTFYQISALWNGKIWLLAKRMCLGLS